MLKQLLFPAKPDGTATSAMLLIARKNCIRYIINEPRYPEVD